MKPGPRIPCCIDGCGRTFPLRPEDDPEAAIICGRHWRMADKRLRERAKRLRARLRKLERLWRRHAIRARGEARMERAWNRTAKAFCAAWEIARQDAAIKAAFGVEDAPRRRPRA